MFGFVCSPYILIQPLYSGSYSICFFTGRGRLHVCVAGYHLSRNPLPPPSYSHRNVQTLDSSTKQPDFTWILRTSTQILRLVKEVEFGQFASNLSQWFGCQYWEVQRHRRELNVFLEPMSSGSLRTNACTLKVGAFCFSRSCFGTLSCL